MNWVRRRCFNTDGDCNVMSDTNISLDATVVSMLGSVIWWRGCNMLGDIHQVDLTDR